MVVETAQQLADRIEAHCAVAGLSLSAFGAAAINDTKLVTDLRRGRQITMRTLQRIEDTIQRTAPTDAAA